MIAQRLPGEARITWLVILDHGLDPGDPGVRAELKSVLTELRAETRGWDSAGSDPGLASSGEIPAVVQSRLWCNQEGAIKKGRWASYVGVMSRGC